MADCEPFVTDDFLFPRRPANRPALDRIAYRIGAYPDMVEAMLRHLDREVALAAWTHCGADDPAIALVEGAAILGDILSFYQERYANEAFLRTAAWRESVADLVRLTGYRLAPGLGGRGTVAFEVKGSRPVTVPAGFPLKADLEESKQPAEFQTETELVAWPHLSRFRLYRKRTYFSAIPSNATEIEIASAGGATTMSAIAALDLQPGDRLMILSAPPAWSTHSSSFTSDQKRPQVVKVKEVRTVLDRTIVTFETPLDQSWSAPATAYRLGRTFRHFGHAAPATFTENVIESGKIAGAKEKTTGYERHVRPNHACANLSLSESVPAEDIPLDQEVQDLAVRSDVIVATRIRYSSSVRDLAVLRRITRLRATSLGYASQTSPLTVVTINAPLVSHSGLYSAEADVRDYRIHEVTSPAIGLRRRAHAYGGNFTTGTEALAFYGTTTEAKEIANRRLTLWDEADGRIQTLTCIDEAADFSGTGDPKLWPLSFDAPPAIFRKEEFDEETGAITVLGNLVDVDEGKAVPTEVLGNGDARAAFQTFRLPKPLTYHISPGATPPHVPELSVYVENRLWRRVASLFGQPLDAQVYVVREDADGVSWVQFGDGRTGARLPSGVGNVSAMFRTGSGARGPLKPDATPNPGERIPEVKKLQMPEGVFGGTDREDSENAREAAPGKVQSLGRLVSLADYEHEMMTIPGVARVRAQWDIADGVPGVVLRVLLQHGREDEFEEVREMIASYQRCRGPNRFALTVEQAFLRQVWIDLRYGLDGRFVEADVEAALIAALAPMDAEEADRHGLFALRARRLGGREYATRIEAVAQTVDGVTWAQVTALGLFSAAASRSDDPLVLPPAPRTLAAQLTPAANELLALKVGALTLHSAPPAVEECA
ncbi:hypothetical protein [Roseitranquillus sediminis]|uniref:hypothetical protein n=1 Tax=Roseitranquillus sediminis TaxID=2809051 RepID=UPI001D0C9133|nr:hypothetical protein [Roseitranquillus sediminis]MBM9594975.1 hypothetical protein [Roseitranquillus sediminis]